MVSPPLPQPWPAPSACFGLRARGPAWHTPPSLHAPLRCRTHTRRRPRPIAKRRQGALHAAHPSPRATRPSTAAGYVLCRADVVVRPNNTADVVAAIKGHTAIAKEQGKALKIRMSRK